MFGPPGTGKTLMARAVAGEAGVPFFVISGSEVTGFLIGLGVARIKKLFRQARKRGGVIFIDELDAIGGRRGRNQSHNEDDRTLNQLLVEMDGFSPREHVLVIGATNRQEDLDPALLRPGRFDRAVAVGLPTASEREAILRLHVRQRGVPLDDDVDLARLARLMPQTSGADLANLVNEAAIAAARERVARGRLAARRAGARPAAPGQGAHRLPRHRRRVARGGRARGRARARRSPLPRRGRTPQGHHPAARPGHGRRPFLPRRAGAAHPPLSRGPDLQGARRTRGRGDRVRARRGDQRRQGRPPAHHAGGAGDGLQAGDGTATPAWWRSTSGKAAGP